MSLACVPVRGADEYSRTWHYSVRMFSYGTLTLATRTGDLKIEGWDNPRLEIDAEKVVWAKSPEQAESLYGQVQVVLEGADKAVSVRTVFPSRRLWRPFRGESKLSVNLTIHMPFDANLVLKCVDGDVRVSGIEGQEELLVNYGDVEIDVPDVWGLRSLRAHAWLGYVQSDLHGVGDQNSSGLRQKLFYFNPNGKQDISVRVRMGGVFVYGYGE